MFQKWILDMPKSIEFNPVSNFAEEVVPYPKPARNYIPEWYRNIPAFRDGKGTEKTIKMCSPFAESFAFGYIQETWEDINIISGDIGENTALIGKRKKVANSFSIPDEYTDVEFVWHPMWIPKLPDGYSALITHPINRVDLPFHTLSGVVEHDTYSQSTINSNLPFLMRKDFSGVIPKGTPMYQIIPFKRDDWQSSPNRYNKELQEASNSQIRSQSPGGYKKIHWKKKDFK